MHDYPFNLDPSVTRRGYVWSFILVSFFGIIFAFLPAGALVQKIVFSVVLLYIAGQQRFKIYFPKGIKSYFGVLTLLAMYSFISSYWLFGSLVIALLVAQKYIFLLFCLIAACQICSVIKAQKNQIFLKRIVKFLIASQFIFVLIKFVILGKIDEGFLIGSMHHSAGQLGFLFPALMMPVVCILFYPTRLWLTLCLILLLVGFGVLNEKRSIIYLGIPIIFSCFYALRSQNWNLSSMLKGSFLLIILIGMLSFSSNKIGSLSGTEAALSIVSENRITYLYSYAIEYLTMDYGGPLQGSELDAISDTGVQVGRAIVWVKGTNFMFSSDTFNQLFGYGFGYITPSEYINASDTLFSRLGFRGAISSAMEILVEGGMVGLTLCSYLLIAPFFSLVSKRRRIRKEVGKGSLEYKNTSILIIILSIFMFDFYFYSNILLSTLPMPLLLFIMIYTIYTPFKRALNDGTELKRIDE